MRLIRASTKELVFFISSQAPPYVILSHTWGKEEILFGDFVEGKLSAKGKQKANSFKKLKYTCAEAVRMKVEYCWIDNCCIDKSSSAELQESINSMYKWYQNALHCYVYLSDFHRVDRQLAEELLKSRWFTRGWTLQELVAPPCLSFFDSSWESLGVLDRRENHGQRFRGTHRPALEDPGPTMVGVVSDHTESDLDPQDISDIISQITRIPKALLIGNLDIYDYSVAQRMSWAANRKTTVPEDIAYSLLGIFGISMSMLYGEGQEAAFERLQKKILKRSTDQTIFAWRDTSTTSLRPKGILARHPLQFDYSYDIVTATEYGSKFGNHDSPYSMTNLGLDIEAPLLAVPSLGLPGVEMLVLNCAFNKRRGSYIGILVIRVAKLSGYSYRRSNAGQFVQTHYWGPLKRIIVTGTSAAQLDFLLDRYCNLSTKNQQEDENWSAAQPVYLSHKLPISSTSSPEEARGWSTIGWTKVKRGAKQGPGCVNLNWGREEYTVWLDTSGKTFQVEKGHSSPPREILFRNRCSQSSTFLEGVYFSVSASSCVYFSPEYDNAVVYFIGAVASDWDIRNN